MRNTPPTPRRVRAAHESKSAAVRAAAAAPSRRQQSKWHREQHQQRTLYLAVGVLVALVLAIFGGGVFYDNVVRANEVVAQVGPDSITAAQLLDEIQPSVRAMDAQAKQIGGGASLAQYIDQQKRSLPDQTLNDMIDQRVIAQEAARRGLSVSPAELDDKERQTVADFQQSNATPTPAPAATPDAAGTPDAASTPEAAGTPAAAAASLATTATGATSSETARAAATASTTSPDTAATGATASATSPGAAALGATAAATSPDAAGASATAAATSPGAAATSPDAAATVAPTPLATPSPVPSPTPVPTLVDSAYGPALQSLLDRNSLSETELRDKLRQSLLRDKVLAAVGAEQVPDTQEQIHARQILVGTQDQASSILAQLQAGADFAQLAQQSSTDAATKDKGGDLGWVTRSGLDKPLADAAFALQPGQTSDVVQSAGGFAIIQVLERDPARPVPPDQLTTLRQKAGSDWLDGRRTGQDVKLQLTQPERDWILARIGIRP